MKYCKKCIVPDTRPFNTFDSDGVCMPCKRFENRKNIDWKARWKELETVAERYRGINGNYYDCIIAVSSGKDSHYQIHVFKEKLNMNPLCVSIDNFSWTNTGRMNYENLGDRFGVDILMLTLNRKVSRKMLRKGFEMELIPTWHWDKAVYAFPLQMAIKLGIPLVIWGENTAYERGGPCDKDNPNALVQLENDVVKPISLDKWLDKDISLKDLNPIIYPTMQEIESAGIEAKFCSYYFPWSGYENYLWARNNGFKGFKETGEWDREGLIGLDYTQVDTIGYDIHPWFKFVKFGHWALTDFLSVDIREGRIAREEAVKIVNEHEYKLDRKVLKDFIDFIGISEEYFWKVVDKFANRNIVEKRNGVWRLKNPVK